MVKFSTIVLGSFLAIATLSQQDEAELISQGPRLIVSKNENERTIIN